MIMECDVTSPTVCVCVCVSDQDRLYPLVSCHRDVIITDCPTTSCLINVECGQTAMSSKIILEMHEEVFTCIT